GVLAGVPFFNEVFSQLNCSVDWFLEEGECFEPVKEIAHVTGRACDILLGERTALNILARCSGIARRFNLYLLSIDLKEFDPDYFVTNCHKWLYTVRGSALLYVPFRNQKNIRHPIVSALCNSGFVKEFSWVGTQDFSSYLTIHHALAFRKKLGGEDKIQSYCRNLAIKGGKLIASILNTEILGPESSIAHMVNIRLPIKVDDGKPNIFESEFHELMFNKYK
ncbi:7080_t:CDS:2, partial [Entrophospora sp. SA101]